jgi:hypothetical protein
MLINKLYDVSSASERVFLASTISLSRSNNLANLEAVFMSSTACGDEKRTNMVGYISLA